MPEMTKKERKELRKMQDAFVAKAKRTNPDFPEDAEVFSDRGVGNPPVTLANLRRYLYPQFKHLIQEYVEEK